MADDRFVTLESRAAGVAVIRLDRPRANALSAQVLHELRAVVEYLAANPPGSVVVTGGERIFAAGADITELGSVEPEQVSANFHAALRPLAALPRVTIAAINGYALGGGLELALACDLRICGESAKLGQPEVLLGVIPGGGGTQRLARLIGPSRAKDLILTGRQVDADEALALGLVNRVVPDTEVLLSAISLAAELARGAPVAQSMAKTAIDDGLDVGVEEGLKIERRYFTAVLRTEDARRGVSSFLEHGPGHASFVGR